MSEFETGIWFTAISILLIVSSLYFVLTFFEQLKKGDERIARQSKFGAVICLALSLLAPVVQQIWMNL